MHPQQQKSLMFIINYRSDKQSMLILLSYKNIIKMTRPQIFTFVTNQTLSWVLQVASTFFWVTSFIYPNQTRMHAMETNLSRSIVGLFINYFLVKYTGGFLDLRNTKTFFLATYRCFTNTIQGMMFAFLMFYLPMPIIHTIAALSAVISAGIEHYCYNIRITLRSRLLILVSVFGVMLHANGQYLSQIIWSTSDGTIERQSDFKNYENVTYFQSFVLSLVFLIWIVIWSYGLVVIKFIKLSVYQLNLYNNLIHLLVTGLGYCTIPQQRKSSIETIGISLLTSGFLVFVAQLCFVFSLQICKSVGIMMIINTLNIVIAYLYSVFLYSQKINILSLIGMIITVICIIFVVSDKYK